MRSREYWEERMIENELRSERSVLEHEKSLLESYDYALVQIKKEIESFYQKYAKDNKVSYAEARRRLNAAEKKDFHTLLREWYKLAQELGMSSDFKNKLQQLGKRVYITRLEALEATIEYEIEKLKTNQYQWVTDLMILNYKAGYYNSYFTVAQGLEISVNFATIDKMSMERTIKERWNGRNYSDSIWGDKDKLIDSISTILPRSFSMGLNSKDLGDMIAKEMGTSKNRGRTLARTEINYLCNQSTLAVYKACGIEYYEFLATLDLRTSDICRGMDGTTHKVSQAKVGVNYPPMHPNCRSTTIPHIEDDDTLDRIARDEDGNNIKVPRRMSQEQWINEYVPEEDKEKLLRFNRKFKSTDDAAAEL